MLVRQRNRGLIYVRGTELSEIRWQILGATKAATFFDIKVQNSYRTCDQAFAQGKSRFDDVFWDDPGKPKDRRHLALQDLQLEVWCDRSISHVIVDAPWRLEGMSKKVRAMKRVFKSIGVALISFDNVADAPNG